LLQCGQNSVESLCPMEQDQHAIGTAVSMTLSTMELSRNNPYDENDEPQPQERVEFGLMKLKPCRISVSS